MSELLFNNVLTSVRYNSFLFPQQLSLGFQLADNLDFFLSFLFRISLN